MLFLSIPHQLQQISPKQTNKNKYQNWTNTKTQITYRSFLYKNPLLRRSEETEKSTTLRLILGNLFFRKKKGEKWEGGILGEGRQKGNKKEWREQRKKKRRKDPQPFIDIPASFHYSELCLFPYVSSSPFKTILPFFLNRATLFSYPHTQSQTHRWVTKFIELLSST